MLNVEIAARKMLLAHWERHVTDAALILHDKWGTTRVGAPAETNRGETVELEIRDPRFYTRTLTLGSLGMGESYMDKDFDVVSGGLDGLWTVLVRNKAKHKARTDPIFAAKYLGILLYNRLRSPAANAQAHYDLGDEVYESFLGSTMMYTCGYAYSADDDTDTLQYNKLDRICRKLQLKPGEKLLDLGCGYGGMLIYAAKHYGIVGTGVTNSNNHAATAMKRAVAAGVGDRVSITGSDFRDPQGEYDKIVSIGMMEHLRESDYSDCFETVARCLRPGGLALLHTACTNSPTNRHDPFIQKYIFPGSNWPSLIQMTTQMANHGFALLDVENMARHYVVTMRRWAENFYANCHTLDPKRYDERFIRMFKFYMGWGVGTASASDGGLYHFLLTNDHARANPLQRV
ncbi:MAG: class I SAM-dependent methyltransferase [Pseudomonadota bacterium]